MNGGTSLRLVWLSRWLATLLLCILGACVLCWSTQYTETNTNSGYLDKIPPPPTPTLSPNPIPLFFQIHHILHLLLAAPKKESEVLSSSTSRWIFYYLINSSIPKFNNKKMHCTRFEHLSAPFFFYPFLADSYHINTYSHDSCVCMRVDDFI